jgi:hypothetical protein
MLVMLVVLVVALEQLPLMVLAVMLASVMLLGMVGARRNGGHQAEHGEAAEDDSKNLQRLHLDFSRIINNGPKEPDERHKNACNPLGGRTLTGLYRIR